MQIGADHWATHSFRPFVSLYSLQQSTTYFIPCFCECMQRIKERNIYIYRNFLWHKFTRNAFDMNKFSQIIFFSLVRCKMWAETSRADCCVCTMLLSWIGKIWYTVFWQTLTRCLIDVISPHVYSHEHWLDILDDDYDYVHCWWNEMHQV